jgi:hypothetical protein
VIDLTDSLDRARREHQAAVDRGDDEAAEMIGRAIVVLEQAREGLLVPQQRQPEE